MHLAAITLSTNAPFSPVMSNESETLNQLANDIKRWALELGFQQAGICEANPGEHIDYLKRWVANDYHGDMQYMKDRIALRSQPSTPLRPRW